MECKRFGKAYSLRSVAVYGGGSMWEQAKALQEGAEIVVCTPVRPAFVFNLAPVNKISTVLQQQMWELQLMCLHRGVWLTTLKRRPHPCREWHTWCLMRQIACLIWALVGWHFQCCNKDFVTCFLHCYLHILFLFSFLEYQVRSIASHVRPDRQSKWLSLYFTLFCFFLF